ncbi:hypothetical protein DL770_003089 [Monosporascus sp. CRB-9-2]|nr:hypothetical protein DL770_003089 [Monosporascus sp. CRB-9-2]
MASTAGTVHNYVPTSTSSNSTSFASITLSHGPSYLFYYDADNNLACLSGSEPGVFSNMTIQTSPGVTIQAGTISPLTATGFESPEGTLEGIRLYYVERDTNLIKELCSVEGKTWYCGDLDKKEYKIASSGGLACSSGATIRLQVFFADANNDGKIVEAYVNRDTMLWESNVIR